MLRAAALVSLAACCSLSAAAPAYAQFVGGRVVHAGTDQPLRDVTVELLTDGGRRIARAVTNDEGAFHMQASRIGEYVIRARRIGLESVTATLSVEVSQRVDILLRMAEAAVPLDPLTVEARSALNIGSLAGYYERTERAQLLGIGTVLTRDWLAERRAGSTGDILRQQPRVTVTSGLYNSGQVRFNSGGRSFCTPQIYLDGILANRTGPLYVNELPQPSDLEGIEIYRGLAEMGEYYDNTGCGVILLWTRRTGDEGPPFSWRRLLSLTGALGVMLILIQSF